MDPIDILNKLNVLYRAAQEAAQEAAQLTPEQLEEMAADAPLLAMAVGQIQSESRATGVDIIVPPTEFGDDTMQSIIEYGGIRVYEALVAAGRPDNDETWDDAQNYAANYIFHGISFTEDDDINRPTVEQLQDLPSSAAVFDQPWKHTAFTALSAYQNVIMFDPSHPLPEHWMAVAVRLGEAGGYVPPGTGARLKFDQISLTPDPTAVAEIGEYDGGGGPGRGPGSLPGRADGGPSRRRVRRGLRPQGLPAVRGGHPVGD